MQGRIGSATKAIGTTGIDHMKKNASGLSAAKPPPAEHAVGLQTVAVVAADEPNQYRITEKYLGRFGSHTISQRARDHVHWIAACVRGPRILDVGCSEGVLELLLARAGHQVLGIDIKPAAIAAARDLLRSEPPAVRNRVELRVADALGVELDETGFDSVVLGEVLEHLTYPAAMLERAAAFLKPGGRLVLTTPFGYFPHGDHRQEFRTTELVRLLSARFVVDELATADGYFRVIAHVLAVPVMQERRAPNAHALLVATEEAAIASQHRLHGQLQQLHDQLALKKDKERASAEKVRRLTSQLEHQRRVVATAQARMRHAQLRLKQEQNGLRQQLGRAVEKSLTSPVKISGCRIGFSRCIAERAKTPAWTRTRPRRESSMRPRLLSLPWLRHR